MTVKELREIVENCNDSDQVVLSICQIHLYPGDHDCEYMDSEDISVSSQDNRLYINASEYIDHRNED